MSGSATPSDFPAAAAGAAVLVGEAELSLADFAAVLDANRPVALAPAALARVARSFDFLREFAQGKLIYGINTGFGPMAQYKIADADLNQLQYNLIRSHCSGLGELLPPRETKAVLLSRLCSLMRGYSGVHPELVQLLVALLNHNALPGIYEHGGVGASGDLVQLAHLALALIGEGELWYQGTVQPAAEVLARLGLQPLRIHYREGLALLNGTSAMAGIGVVNLLKARQLLSWSLTLTATMLQLVEAYDDAISPELNGVKLHPGQQQVAAELRARAAGSQLLRRREQVLYKAENLGTDVLHDKVQEYYSLRCAPQILGPVLEAIEQAERVVLREVASVNDNPIIDADSANVYHGGNFHGDYVAFEMDKLKTALTKLAVLAERQLNYLLNDKLNQKLPPFLNRGRLGLNFGLQGLQFTATSTVAECQALSTPVYVHSIPNNNDNQDVVSMGTNAAVLARRVADNAAQVLAVHAAAVLQATDILDALPRLSATSQRAYHAVRALLPPTTGADAPQFRQLRAVAAFISAHEPAAHQARLPDPLPHP